jgi:hypothetical protein
LTGTLTAVHVDEDTPPAIPAHVQFHGPSTGPLITDAVPPKHSVADTVITHEDVNDPPLASPHAPFTGILLAPHDAVVPPADPLHVHVHGPCSGPPITDAFPP